MYSLYGVREKLSEKGTLISITEKMRIRSGGIKMELAEVVMNPVRQRIYQYLLIHEKGTVKEIKKELPDISGASLYSHIKILANHSIITVAEENRIRGTVEKVYQINKSALEIDDENGLAVQAALMRIGTAFAKYFAKGDVNPRKDMLLFTGCTLTLTDDEFADFLGEINEVAMKYMAKPVTDESRTRQVSVVSSPVDL